MTEWYIDVNEKYLPLILPLIPDDEKIIHKFVGSFDSWGANSKRGVYALTEKKLYFRGRPFGKGFAPVWKTSAAREVQIVPLDKILEIIHKKHKLVFRVNLDWLGGKFIGKIGKLKIEVYQGKSKKQKESKIDWLKRVDEIKSYFESKKSN